MKISGKIQQWGVIRCGPRKSRIDKDDWYEIEAEVEIESSDPLRLIPELEAEWFALITDDGVQKTVRLLGTAKFKDLKIADKKIRLSAYIAPATLKRFTGTSKITGKNIDHLALTLSGPGIRTEGRHAEGLVKASSDKETEWWLNWDDESLDGAILAKSKTPFARLWFDRYATEKVDNLEGKAGEPNRR